MLFWSEEQLKAKLDVLAEAMPGQDLSKVRMARLNPCSSMVHEGHICLCAVAAGGLNLAC